MPAHGRAASPYNAGPCSAGVPMASFFLLMICLALGVLFARWDRLPQQSPAALNAWIINVALPALVMELVPQLDFNVEIWFLIVSSWIVFFGAWALFAWLGRLCAWSRARVGALVLTAGLGNTSFMGYPMIEAMRGQPGLALAVLGDQLGTFIALAVGGVVVASLYSGRRPNVRDIGRRMATFPPFIGLIVGIVVGQLGGWPPVIGEVLARLAATLTPLALFSVGLQFRLTVGHGMRLPLMLGLGWKLCLAPLIAAGIGLASGVNELPFAVGVLEAAMAPMVTAGILAAQFDLEPKLANSVVSLGTLLSLATVPLANALL